MADKNLRYMALGGLICGLAFLALLAFRIGLFEKADSFRAAVNPEALLSDRETWMKVLQNDRKIGYSHSRLQQTENGYLLQEELVMQINTMGLSQRMEMNTRADLLMDQSLDRFELAIRSGPFHFKAAGQIKADHVSVRTETNGDEQAMEIPIKEKPSLAVALIPAVVAGNPAPGASFSYSLFDPLSMGSQTVKVHVAGEETIQFQGRPASTRKLIINYQGMIQTAWIDQNGDVLREEGLLGLRLEKADRREALADLPDETDQDLTLAAAVPTNRTIENPAGLTSLVVRIGGVDVKGLVMEGGRQTYADELLRIRKEVLAELPTQIPADSLPPEIRSQLAPSLFIQADHPRIRQLVGEITAKADSPLVKIQKIMTWIHREIKRRPVLSLPNAVATLDNRVGDCNEHAVLFAALARAAGIPTRVEAGLVYMQERFYYHAWNAVFIGRWITLDALFRQFPADVTHLRFAVGEQNLQTALAALIGRVTITVEALDENQDKASTLAQEEEHVDPTR